MKIAKSIISSALVALLIMVLIEMILVYFGGYNEVIIGNEHCSYKVEGHDFNHYESNCRLFYKNWEQDEGVWYRFNQHGRRDNEDLNIEKSMAFVGDSFTLGAMVKSQETIPAYLKAKGNFERYAFHNYGVGGEQFHNLYEKLKVYDFTSYEKIILNITPNDFFDIVDGTDPNLNSKHINLSNETDISTVYESINGFILNLSITRALLYHFLSVDKNYYQIYKKRLPYSGYLENPISDDFKNALEHFGASITTLDSGVKSKLYIFLLPQRAEIVSYRLGFHDIPFHREFAAMCNKYNLSCGFPDISKLNEIKGDSHYIVDGHLKSAGNAIIANDLYDYLTAVQK